MSIKKYPLEADKLWVIGDVAYAVTPYHTTKVLKEMNYENKNLTLCQQLYIIIDV